MTTFVVVVAQTEYTAYTVEATNRAAARLRVNEAIRGRQEFPEQHQPDGFGDDAEVIDVRRAK